MYGQSFSRFTVSVIACLETVFCCFVITVLKTILCCINKSFFLVTTDVCFAILLLFVFFAFVIYVINSRVFICVQNIVFVIWAFSTTVCKLYNIRRFEIFKIKFKNNSILLLHFQFAYIHIHSRICKNNSNLVRTSQQWLVVVTSATFSLCLKSRVTQTIGLLTPSEFWPSPAVINTPTLSCHNTR